MSCAQHYPHFITSLHSLTPYSFFFPPRNPSDLPSSPCLPIHHPHTSPSSYPPPFMSETCALCLGGESEVPPLGTLKDARDLIQPCSTCHLVTHRKCLIDYINSLSFSRIERELVGPDDPSGPSGSSGPTDPGGPTDPADPSDLVGVESNNNPDESRILAAAMQARLEVLLGAGAVETRAPLHSPDSPKLWRLSAPCPQCKSKIRFQLQGLAVLGINTFVRDKITGFVLYATIGLGLLGASAGIVSVGVTGLTVCGLNMVKALSPSFLDSLKHAAAPRPDAWAANAPLPASSLMKLHQISLLPIIMYRMRGLLLMDCLFKRRPRPAWPELFNELLICNFLSALGNHVLAKSLWANTKRLFAQSRGPASALGLLKGGFLLRNITWTSPAVLIALVVPFRWAYDIFYRETFNRLYYSMARAVRPKDLVDSLSPKDFARLEALEATISSLSMTLAPKINLARKTRSPLPILSLLKDKHFYWYMLCIFQHTLYKSRACLAHDYSDSLLVKLGVVTLVTTILWPFLASYLGKAVCSGLRSVPYFMSAADLPFLSNLLAMGILAVAKDASNLFLGYQKTRQLSHIAIVKTDRGSA